MNDSTGVGGETAVEVRKHQRTRASVEQWACATCVGGGGDAKVRKHQRP